MRSSRFGNRKAIRTKLTVFCFLAALFFTIPVNPQIAGTGNIQGSVSDPSGAVIPNATVTATDTSTQVKHATISDKAGVYAFPGLPIGTYNLRVSAQGFEAYQQTGIVLEVGSSIAINPALAVGRATITD
jgi:hypothetical protein